MLLKLKKIFRLFAADIRSRRNAIDLSFLKDYDVHPVAVSYRSGEGDVLLNVPLSRCRHFSWLSYPCTINSDSPFIKTLLHYKEGICLQYEGSALEKFYSHWQPQNAADLLLLKNPSYERFRNLPPSATPLLWADQNPDDLVRSRKYAIERDNRLHGAKLSHEDGDTFFGPVSARKGSLEFSRLIRVYESIKKNGFKIDYLGFENVYVVCLFEDLKTDTYCFLVSSGGQHRLAALTALGYDRVTVQLSSREGIKGLVRLSDIDRWPSVVNGYFSKDEAFSLFIRLMGNQEHK